MNIEEEEPASEMLSSIHSIGQDESTDRRKRSTRVHSEQQRAAAFLKNEEDEETCFQDLFSSLSQGLS